MSVKWGISAISSKDEGFLHPYATMRIYFSLCKDSVTHFDLLPDHSACLQSQMGGDL
jgi:hypothetical protein